jgi:hypothetical protein
MVDIMKVGMFGVGKTKHRYFSGAAVYVNNYLGFYMLTDPSSISVSQ